MHLIINNNITSLYIYMLGSRAIIKISFFFTKREGLFKTKSLKL